MEVISAEHHHVELQDRDWKFIPYLYDIVSEDKTWSNLVIHGYGLSSSYYMSSVK